MLENTQPSKMKIVHITFQPRVLLYIYSTSIRVQGIMTAKEKHDIENDIIEISPLSREILKITHWLYCFFDFSVFVSITFNLLFSFVGFYYFSSSKRHHINYLW